MDPMKRWIAPLLLALPLAAAARDRMRLGADLAIPYRLAVDGGAQRERANMNLGADARYYFTDAFSVGSRLGFDLQDEHGPRQVNLSPGVQYRWLPAERFSPYARADVPLIFQGAVNEDAADDRFDVALHGGFGLALNLGRSLDWGGLVLRYDCGVGYTFGLASALPVMEIEFARFGLDYVF